MGAALLSSTRALAATTYAQPYIKHFSPASGKVGTVITVYGSGFTGANKAWVGSAHDAGFRIVNNDEAQITVPKDAVTGQLVLLNPQHAVFSATKFTVVASAAPTAPPKSSTAAQPYITSYSPSSGKVGTLITMHGRGFTGLTGAWIGTGHDALVKVVSDSQVDITVPKDAVTGKIAVLNKLHYAFSAAAFLVSSAPPVTGGTGSTTGSGSGALSVRVLGDHFIDAKGNVLQLRGVSASGLEFTAAQGWDPADPWGGVSPNWAGIKSWKSNTVRLPLNEASWLGYTCVDGTGAARNPDPGHNYQTTVKNTVAAATAAGLYVILDLHWTAPKNFCPLAQNPMADADHSVAFWSSIAATFKGYPNVMFELFNEPFIFWQAAGENDWQVLMRGGTVTQYITGDSKRYQVAYNWKVAGMQQLLDTVRATGATNVILVSGLSWSQDLSQWAAYKPTDPEHQMAAVWHAYPNSGTVGNPQAAVPKFGSIGYTWTQSVINAGYPVLITEFGDHDADGTVGAPFVSKLLPWADDHGISYIGWTWDPWGDPDNVLITNESGTPTAGYGVYTKAHYVCLGSGGGNCP